MSMPRGLFMKRYLLAAAALLALPATAQAQVTIQGTSTVGTIQSSDPGLVVYANPINFGPFNLDLDAGTATPSSRTVDVLTIGTDEGSVELFEDTVANPISINFSFTNPFDATGAAVSGSTYGFYRLFSCTVFTGGCGAVDWSDTPTVFNFGDGGSFSLALNDVAFGTPGSATVSGRFTLLTNSVPEPGTWAMRLMGFGAAGVAMRRSRRQPRLAQLA
jgi:hypothetical protein